MCLPAVPLIVCAAQCAGRAVVLMPLQHLANSFAADDNTAQLVAGEHHAPAAWLEIEG
jgi:hypothetical protein